MPKATRPAKDRKSSQVDRRPSMDDVINALAEMYGESEIRRYGNPFKQDLSIRTDLPTLLKNILTKTEKKNDPFPLVLAEVVAKLSGPDLLSFMAALGLFLHYRAQASSSSWRSLVSGASSHEEQTIRALGRYVDLAVRDGSKDLKKIKHAA